MLKIGITGNAGGGKTLALNYLRSLGVGGISADETNAELRQHCKFIITILEIILNTKLFNQLGQVDTTQLSNIIFSSPAAKVPIEATLHPLIVENLDLQYALLPKKEYCIIEIPLLFEAKMLAYVDFVLLITAENKILTTRINTRNNIPSKGAQLILNNQRPDLDKFPHSDDIVLNNDTPTIFQGHLKKLIN